MHDLARYPLLVFIVSLLVLWFSARVGAFVRNGNAPMRTFRKIWKSSSPPPSPCWVLIIGFTFSMAISRYDQRKIYEEEEANAIGTEYLRASLLPADDGTRVRTMLITYLHQRIAFYEASNLASVREINEETSRQQTELWSAVQKVALENPTPVNALTLSGMNDVLNSRATRRPPGGIASRLLHGC